MSDNTPIDEVMNVISLHVDNYNKECLEIRIEKVLQNYVTKEQHKEDVINHIQGYILWRRKQDNISDPYDKEKSRIEAENYYKENYEEI